MDWFKINQPYVITSQGSSGSEMHMVSRCHAIAKALRPEVRNWLIENRRAGDVISYLMRSNLHGGYLDPLAHRVVSNTRVFNQDDIDLASSITLDTIPPKLTIEVISDSHDVRDSRGWPITSTIRTPELAGFQRLDASPIRTIVVELSSDKPCQFHWLKTQGVSTVTFQNPEKSRATITIPFQTDFDVTRPNGTTLISNRVEIIAVAYDGTHYSSPVFVTEYFTPLARETVTKMNEVLRMYQVPKGLEDTTT